MPTTDTIAAALYGDDFSEDAFDDPGYEQSICLQGGSVWCAFGELSDNGIYVRRVDATSFDEWGPINSNVGRYPAIVTDGTLIWVAYVEPVSGDEEIGRAHV